MASTVITIEPSAVQKKIRVAAYCRVSSSSEDQLHSFAAQVQHYTKFIRSNDQMELVDIYADEGLTGTKTAKREEFNRMIADCKKGRIDRVLTKSLSRFARNTADALMYARILRENGVSILFEKENIDTAFMSSELLLALSGAQAQEESISISKNMRWSIERRMKNGTFIPSNTPYGYRMENGQFVIVEDEAKIVCWIFESFLSGMGKKDIADLLQTQSLPKGFDHSTWSIHTVDYILRNERYIGNALLKKQYRTECIPFKAVHNRGQKPQYYVEDTNPAIITKEVFYAAQERLNSESGRKRKNPTETVLNRKIYCPCGCWYKPLTVGDKKYWECRKRNADSSVCGSRRIPEKDIYEAFITMVNKLRNLTEIITAAIRQTESLNMRSGGVTDRIREIDRSIAELSNKNLVLARLNAKGMFRASEYTEKSNRINSKINELRTERKNLLREQDEDSVLSGLRQLEQIMAEIKEPLTDFNEELFGRIVRQITMPTHQTICFELIGKIKLTEQISEQVRCKQK